MKQFTRAMHRLAISSSAKRCQVQGRLTEINRMVPGGSPPDLGKLVTEETKKCAELVKFFGREAELIDQRATAIIGIAGPQP